MIYTGYGLLYIDLQLLISHLIPLSPIRYKILLALPSRAVAAAAAADIAHKYQSWSNTHSHTLHILDPRDPPSMIAHPSNCRLHSQIKEDIDRLSLIRRSNEMFPASA